MNLKIIYFSFIFLFLIGCGIDPFHSSEEVGGFSAFPLREGNCWIYDVRYNSYHFLDTAEITEYDYITSLKKWVYLYKEINFKKTNTPSPRFSVYRYLDSDLGRLCEYGFKVKDKFGKDREVIYEKPLVLADYLNPANIGSVSTFNADIDYIGISSIVLNDSSVYAIETEIKYSYGSNIWEFLGFEEISPRYRYFMNNSGFNRIRSAKLKINLKKQYQRK